MIKKIAALGAVAMMAFSGLLFAGDTPSFDMLFREYEAIRTALASDSLDGVSARATAIATLALELDEAEKRTEDYAPCCDALALIAKSADELAAVSTLAEAREGFHALSKPMIRYRDRTGAEGVVTLHCPMKDASCLQRAGEAIGNPYTGTAMARCGNVVEPGKSDSPHAGGRH